MASFFGRMGITTPLESITSLELQLATALIQTYRWFTSRRQPQALRYNIGSPNEVYDTVCEDCEDADASSLDKAGSPIERKRARRRFLSRIVAEARAHFPPMKRTQANSLVLDRWFRDQMVGHGVRPTHIAALKPLAIAVFYVRSEADIAAAEFASSELVDTQERRYKEAWAPTKPGLWSYLLGRRTHAVLCHTDV